MRLSDANTLTARGAQLLRSARDHILANADRFDMAYWGYEPTCGASMCIAGWIRHVGQIRAGHPDYVSADVVEALGFDRNNMQVRDRLFLGDVLDRGPEGAVRAAERINAFLWDYGYPADAITAGGSERQRSVEDARATNAVREEPELPVLAPRA